LKQTDYDGQFEYSNIIGVNSSMLKSITESQVNVFPNPFKLNEGILNVQVNDFNSDENINIKVIDITGKTVYESTESSDSDSFIRTIQLSNEVSKGSYFVIISNSYDRQVSKLLIN
jgi:type IX secretion system substrate protein